MSETIGALMRRAEGPSSTIRRTEEATHNIDIVLNDFISRAADSQMQTGRQTGSDNAQACEEGTQQYLCPYLYLCLEDVL